MIYIKAGAKGENNGIFPSRRIIKAPAEYRSIGRHLNIRNTNIKIVKIGPFVCTKYVINPASLSGIT